MERNHNEQQIVMSIEHYQNLLGMADRSRYTTKKIEKHVRKHNPFLQAPHQDIVREFESARSKRIRDARKLLAKTTGKVVFVETSVNYSSEPLEDLVFTPMIVKRLNKGNRGQLLVFKEGETKFGHYSASSVTPDCIHLELPADYYQIPDSPWVSSYSNLWVKIDSPMYWHAQESMARLEDDERNEAKKALEEAANPTPKVLVQAVHRIHYHDVIGER